MKQILLTFSLITLIFAAGACTSDQANDATASSNTTKIEANKATKNATNQKPAARSASTQKGAINWVTVEELEQKMKQEPRKVLVDLYTSWCGWCKRMDRSTFAHQDIASYVNDNFYAVKFNAEQKETVKFNGGEYKFVPGGRKGTNELAKKFILGDAKSGRMGYPTIAFLDENLNRIDAFPGFKDAKKFEPLIEFIAGEHYKSKSLNEFQQGFESKIQASNAKGMMNSKIKPNQMVKIQPKASGQP
ncbi:MAG: thioredoxin family protein [Chitinophagales bacterium]